VNIPINDNKEVCLYILLISWSSTDRCSAQLLSNKHTSITNRA